MLREENIWNGLLFLIIGSSPLERRTILPGSTADERIPPDEHPVFEENGYFKVNWGRWPLRISSSGSMIMGYLLMILMLVPMPVLPMKHQRYMKRASTVQKTKAFLWPFTASTPPSNKGPCGLHYSLKDVNQSSIPRCRQNHRTLNL